jgi:cytochrome c-type biogenesis protein CcmH
MKIVRRISLLVPVLLAALWFSAALAQDSGPTTGQSEAVSDDAVNAVAKGMYCPVCENVPLDVCGTQACIQWRALIRQQLAEGWTEAQIHAYFVEQYGDRVLAEPPRRGLNWIVYLLPPLIVAVGGLIVFRVLRTWQQFAVAQEPAASETASNEYLERMEEALRQHD